MPSQQAWRYSQPHPGRFHSSLNQVNTSHLHQGPSEHSPPLAAWSPSGVGDSHLVLPYPPPSSWPPFPIFFLSNSVHTPLGQIPPYVAPSSELAIPAEAIS